MIKNPLQFRLVVEYLAVDLSFRQLRNVLNATMEISVA
jgi:hypothetical protein